MLRNFARALALALGLMVASAGAGAAQTDVGVAVGASGGQIDVSFFYQNLASDGEWFQHPTYGWCWTPYDVSADWRPYYDGHWEYTDDGWSWASNEPWGWATYHYGRWFFDDTYGWAWVPGSEWAPAWVAWRDADDYVGWAPLPPGADWDDATGLAFADASAIPADEWCFVPQQNLTDVNLAVVVAPIPLNVTIIGRSRDATRYELRAGRPANVGPDVARIEARLGHSVVRVRTTDIDAPARGDGRVVADGTVGFFRPRVTGSPRAQAPPPELTGRGNAIPDADLARMRQDRQKRLESDLTAERARMMQAQQQEMRAQAAGASADAIRQRQVAEQRAFEAHAARQRQVFTQRMEKRVVRPAGGPVPPNGGRPGNAPGNGPGNGRGNGQGNGNGNGKDRGGH